MRRAKEMVTATSGMVRNVASGTITIKQTSNPMNMLAPSILSQQKKNFESGFWVSLSPCSLYLGLLNAKKAITTLEPVTLATYAGWRTWPLTLVLLVLPPRRLKQSSTGCRQLETGPQSHMSSLMLLQRLTHIHTHTISHTAPHCWIHLR